MGPFSVTLRMLLLSMFINHIPPSNIFNFVFQKLFVHDFNKDRYCNATLGFLAEPFEVVLKIMTVAELFIVMITSPG